METTQITANLEISFDRGRVSGRVAQEGRAAQSFDGWLGLMGAIDALASAPKEEANRDDH